METEKELERSLEAVDIERELSRAPQEPPVEALPHVITVQAGKVGHERVCLIETHSRSLSIHIWCRLRSITRDFDAEALSLYTHALVT